MPTELSKLGGDVGRGGDGPRPFQRVSLGADLHSGTGQKIQYSQGARWAAMAVGRKVHQELWAVALPGYRAADKAGRTVGVSHNDLQELGRSSSISAQSNRPEWCFKLEQHRQERANQAGTNAFYDAAHHSLAPIEIR